MKPAPSKKVFRCAIYTRKSTEHNLDLEFNSLDAQREACEAYIKSQAHEGWRLIPDRYDDGGLSGASLERPALQTLLTDIRAGKIDIVVVYKVDRLTRSLADFAKLVELFDAQSVSFVSVTQSFNTTSSMGRLTLNVLLSFAQFEREVIGERVRDKIAASKRKGIWVGGSIPLGYACVDKKVVIVPEEADLVRLIFKRYLAVGSIGLAEDLNRKGIKTKRSTLSTGRVRGGIPFSTGALDYLLHNRFYIGEVVYRSETHRGDFEPILDRKLFEAVQTSLTDKAVARQARLKSSPAILTGRIFDDRGNPMTPTHSSKRGVRYRYYVSHALLQRRAAEAGSVRRIAAPEIEAAVVDAIRFVSRCHRGGRSAAERELIERYLDRLTVKPDQLEVRLAAASRCEQGYDEEGQTHMADLENARSDGDGPEPIVLRSPWSVASPSAVKGVLHAPSTRASLKPETRDTLLTAIAKARSWIEDIVEGRAVSLAQIAAREGRGERHIRMLAPLAFVSPKLVSEIVDGCAPASLTSPVWQRHSLIYGLSRPGRADLPLGAMRIDRLQDGTTCVSTTIRLLCRPERLVAGLCLFRGHVSHSLGFT